MSEDGGVKSRFLEGFERGEGRPSKLPKKHVIILYWSGREEAAKRGVDRLRIRHPSVKVKIVNALKESGKTRAHKVTQYPTVLLLKNGREIDRVTGSPASSDTVLSQLFRRANS